MYHLCLPRQYEFVRVVEVVTACGTTFHIHEKGKQLYRTQSSLLATYSFTTMDIQSYKRAKPTTPTNSIEYLIKSFRRDAQYCPF